MRSTPMRLRIVAPFLLMSLSLAACTGEKEPDESDSPPPSAEEIAYHDCLKEQGVKIWHTDYGAPRVDKTQPMEKVLAAQEACKDKLPPGPKPSPASSARMAEAREETACMRREGVAWYPDPDPVTGEFDDRGLTRDQLRSLKTEHAEKMQLCVKGLGRG
ncbi:hypothetical protein ACIQUQ_26140 [Streptomyces sp. NPDC101118]|uniref:hypothetical protein n=1 Tax=Streptomyces sp. NPDC101118 TaxID=3366109 RepID=UPI003806C198